MFKYNWKKFTFIISNFPVSDGQAERMYYTVILILF
ncbi:hypothetical protein ZPR_3607 [Zunongwangia profunda SM-A87]|uniref:Uncharacterized protein n=1 Tax=Zunongwangia profunda (strain DSM 18752 / CCTCC AB 206139 / SM-A87) TaxID=655815 RepID=D5BKL0_ZUNPS|nr:hypothetical protein ZPR_3607 [Zunongwangia profunda SM-A87]